MKDSVETFIKAESKTLSASQDESVINQLESVAFKAARQVIQAAREKNVLLGCCESFTAGLFGSLLGSVSGASAVFKGGFITYFTEIKETVVGVDPKIIQEFGVVSAQCAAAMAENSRKLLDCHLAVSFTGNAGPSSLEGKPAGLVYCAVSMADKTFIYPMRIDLPRNELRIQACISMLDILYRIISSR